MSVGVVNGRSAWRGLGVGLALAAGLAWGQAPQRPDAMVSVYRHSAGADMFKVRMLAPGYPVETLRAQVNEFGRLLGSAPRGLYVYGEKLGSADRLETATAVFAVDGFFDPASGSVRLQPLVRALASPAVRGLSVSLAEVAPAAGTLKSWSDGGSEVARSDMPGGTGMEFRVLLKGSKAEDIVIPDVATAVPARPSPAASKGQGPQPLVWGVLAAGLVVGGALVYFGVSANRPGPRKQA